MRQTYRRKRRKARRANRRIVIMTFLVVIVMLAAALGFGKAVLEGESGVQLWQMADEETAPKIPEAKESAAKEPMPEETQPHEPEALWNLTLVNRWNPIPENYVPQLVEVPGGEMVDARIYEPLMEMLEAASAQNLGPKVVSGYRTGQTQQSLYEDKLREYEALGYSQSEAAQLAQEWVAIPGTSEHQLGLAVDINGDVYDIYLWLQENSYKYGFIFRYPESKTEITGVAQEVWHYRYVGVEVAKAIYEQGLCLEEYLENTGSR